MAGKSAAHVESLIDRTRGDTILDYRDGDEKLVQALKAAGKESGKPLLHAFDAVSDNGSYENLGRVLDAGAKMTLVLPGKDYTVIPDHIEHSMTNVGCVHKPDREDRDRDFGNVYFRYLARGLQTGWFRPQPHEVVPGGLGGVQGALERLRDGKANAVKYVFRIRDTEGVE